MICFSGIQLDQALRQQNPFLFPAGQRMKKAAKETFQGEPANCFTNHSLSGFSRKPMVLIVTPYLHHFLHFKRIG